MERSAVGSLLRTTQAYCLQLCEKQTMELGIAYYNKRFPDLPEVNQYREVIAQTSSELERAYQEAQAWFTSQGLRFHRWVSADGHASSEQADFLANKGFGVRAQDVLALTKWVDGEIPSGVRILPARAVRLAYQQWLTDLPDPDPNSDLGLTQSISDRAQWVAANLERLDDPQYDMFVAQIDKQLVGRCAFYQVGDIGRVMDLTVLPQQAKLAKNALLQYVLAMAKRLEIRNICAQVDALDKAKLQEFEAMGFEAVGQLEQFERPTNI